MFEQIKPIIEYYLKQYFPDIKEDVQGLYVAIIILGGMAILAILTFLWKGCKWLYLYQRTNQLNKDLAPYFSEIEVHNAVKNYVQTKFQNVSPDEDEEYTHNHAWIAQQKLIPFFVKEAFNKNKDDRKHYVILSGAGMGKTTFMINLYLAYKNQFDWFGLRTKYDIKLFPLADKRILGEVEKIENKKNTILLLDAFDEDIAAVQDYKKRLDEIIEATQDFREVVITCRTQFFPKETEEPKRTGLMKYGGEKGEYEFSKIYISPFNSKDIKKYLLKKFGFWNFLKIKKAKEIVEQSPKLMVRPMLLNYVDDLLGENVQYEYTFQIYEKLVEKWIEREARRLSSVDFDKFKKELYNFSLKIARFMYENRANQNGRLRINVEAIKPFAQSCSIELDEMELKSRSLLNRDADGWYKFAHKSIIEYFLMENMCADMDFAKKFDFTGMEITTEFFMQKFASVMLKEDHLICYHSDIDPSVSLSFSRNDVVSNHINLFLLQKKEIRIFHLWRHTDNPELKIKRYSAKEQCEFFFDFFNGFHQTSLDPKKEAIIKYISTFNDELSIKVFEKTKNITNIKKFYETVYGVMYNYEKKNQMKYIIHINCLLDYCLIGMDKYQNEITYKQKDKKGRIRFEPILTEEEVSKFYQVPLLRDKSLETPVIDITPVTAIIAPIQTNKNNNQINTTAKTLQKDNKVSTNQGNNNNRKDFKSRKK